MRRAITWGMVVVLASTVLVVPARAAKVVLGVDCTAVQAPQSLRALQMQTNQRASMILAGCGFAPAGNPRPSSAPAGKPGPTPLGPEPLLINVNVITGTETFPHVTQSESMVWSSDGSSVAVAYNDSRGVTLSPPILEGVSVSSDGGATWTRLTPSPFTGHGGNFGDPILVFNAALHTWFAGALASGCGGFGIGLWTSTGNPPTSWAVGACAHNGTSDDRESMWVDNNPTSPFYGRMYVSLNNFAAPGAPILVTHSDDGISWSHPVQLNTGHFFVRNVQLTGSLDDGTVYVAGMDEGGGQFNTRRNLMYTSFDGGDTWVENIMGSRFAAAGDSLCAPGSYFPRFNPIWRQTGFGQPVGGTGGAVHYVYNGAGRNPHDPGDIYYTTSTDFGADWSDPVVLNTDQAAGGTKAQWMPSLSISASGRLRAGWYDRRDTTNGQNYEYFLRESVDGGNTWGTDFPISNVLIDQPAQPDPFIQACYAGDYNYHTTFGETSYVTWTDGRVVISGVNVQKVFFSHFP